MSTVSPIPYIWYNFDTISSSTVKNSGSAGSLLDATLNNGASVVSNESPTGSTCLNLNNTPVKLSTDPTGQYLSIPPFTLGGPFSCSCWFKKADSKEAWSRIFDFSLTPNGGKSLLLGFVGTSGSIFGSNSGANVYSNQPNLCDNKWHHVVIVSDGTNLVFYVDNVKVNTVKFPALENVQRVNNYIGRSSYTDPYSTIQIDDFRVYTTALTDSNIASLFTYKKIVPATPTVVSSTDDLKTYGIWIFIVVILLFIGSRFMFS